MSDHVTVEELATEQVPTLAAQVPRTANRLAGRFAAKLVGCAVAAPLVTVAVTLTVPPVPLQTSGSPRLAFKSWTFNTAELLGAAGPLEVINGPVVLTFVPTVVPVTLTEIVQVPPAASVPPDKLIVPEPAAAVTAPPHVFVTLAGVATTNPSGKGSEKARPLTARFVSGLLIVKFRLVVPLSRMFVAPNALLIIVGQTVLKI